MKKDVNAANSTSSWNNTNSVVQVGPGTLGTPSAADLTTRAYLTKLGTTGKYAWWIGSENHKARIDKARKEPRSPNSTNAWELSHRDTAEVGVGKLDGFGSLDNNSTISETLIATQTLSQAKINEDDVKKHFFDLISR